MNKYNKNIDVLEHMVKYCNEIEESNEYFHSDFNTFTTLSIYKNSCVMCLLQIGELVGSLSKEFKQQNNQIAWDNMRTTRHIAAHDYESLNLVKLWGTIIKDIPRLKAFCEKTVRQFYSEHPELVDEDEPEL